MVYKNLIQEGIQGNLMLNRNWSSWFEYWSCEVKNTMMGTNEMSVLCISTESTRHPNQVFFQINHTTVHWGNPDLHPLFRWFYFQQRVSATPDICHSCINTRTTVFLTTLTQNMSAYFLNFWMIPQLVEKREFFTCNLTVKAAAPSDQHVCWWISTTHSF